MYLKKFAFAAILAALPTLAPAAIVNLSATGIVTNGDPHLGTPFSLTFSYDTSVAPTFVNDYDNDGVVDQAFWGSTLFTAPFVFNGSNGSFSVSGWVLNVLYNGVGAQPGYSKTSYSFVGYAGTYSNAGIEYYTETQDKFADGLRTIFPAPVIGYAGGYGSVEDQGGSDQVQGPVTISTSFAAVPEPATWAMMIGGFGVVGAAMRRRRVIALT